MIYKLQNGGVVKLQNAWTTMPSVEDAILRAWSNQSAKEKAEKQVASEKPKYTYVNPYDYLHGWREATEDAAKQDKYTVENLGGSKEEAEAVYNASKENAAKQLAGTTATGLGTVALLGLSGGAAGPVAADIVNTGFGAHGLYNALSGNGIQKTIRLANQGDTWGTVKSGAGDLLDLSMGLHTAKLWGNLGKSMLAGQSLGNAYRGNIAGRELSNGVRSFNVSKNPFYSNPTVVSTIDHLYKEHPELATIGPKEAYSQYYKTIFPASKVQIPYAHGTRGDLSKGLEGSTKISYTAAPETIGRNDFYLNLQPEASLQYADGIGVPEGFTWNKDRFWPLKEILGKPYKSDSWMFEPIQLRRQIPNRAGQFSRVKNADGTYSGHGKLLEEYKAELGMQDLSDKEFLQKFGIKDGETFEQWVAENKQKFSDIYNSGDYQGLYHVKVDASNPLTINGGNTYYSERGIWDKMNAGKNDILLHNNAANEFGSDVMVVKDVDPSKVRILGSDPDKQAFIDFMNGHNISFTPAPQKFISTVHFDPKVKLLSRPSPSKIAIDTDERFLSGQNLLYSLDGTSIGSTIDAHGISKGLTSQQLDQLEQILNSGISKNIYTAPLARIDGVGSALGTSSGTAYTDGMFIVAGKPGKSLHDGIDTILINSADENYAQALKTYYSKKYPNFNFITYNEAPAYYGAEKKIIPEVKMTTTPIKTNATNKLDINELPPPPEEVNFVLKQGGILKAQHGFDLSRLNWTDISNHILGFAADVRNKINKMNRYTPEMVPVIGTDSLKTERRGKIGPFVSARGKDPKIVEDGGEI